ncbi:hypothetical protein V6N13_087039 [Hibiscus sabdariffa]
MKLSRTCRLFANKASIAMVKRGSCLPVATHRQLFTLPTVLRTVTTVYSGTLNSVVSCRVMSLIEGYHSENDGESCKVLSHGFPKYLFVAICLALYFLLKINKLAAAARHDRIQYFLSVSETILNKSGAF